MTQPDRLSLGRSARRSVGYASAAATVCGGAENIHGKTQARDPGGHRVVDVIGGSQAAPSLYHGEENGYQQAPDYPVGPCLSRCGRADEYGKSQQGADDRYGHRTGQPQRQHERGADPGHRYAPCTGGGSINAGKAKRVKQPEQNRDYESGNDCRQLCLSGAGTEDTAEENAKCGIGIGAVYV